MSEFSFLHPTCLISWTMFHVADLILAIAFSIITFSYAGIHGFESKFYLFLTSLDCQAYLVMVVTRVIGC
uniref:Putative ovule protein n=1 Tax=Solanum chacoense TaxID=4108 RepID=A0A0V0GPC0_SOLCH